MSTASLKTNPPKRLFIARAIEEQISSGQLLPGERLATVRMLCDKFSVSPTVIQNALKSLIHDGFIECRGASGYYVNDHLASRVKKDQEPSQVENGKKSSSGKARIYFCHHNDISWRRSAAEYRKIQEIQLLKEFEYAEKYDGFSFQIEQAVIAENFFKTHPELLESAKKLAKSGQLELCGEYVITDLNMVSGESIFRNLELANRFYREIFGQTPFLARFNDAFGMCAQLPAILKHCGIDTLSPARTPNSPLEISESDLFSWDTLSGDAGVTVFRNTAEITHLGYNANMPILQSPESRLAKSLMAIKELPGDILACYTTEESFFQESFFHILALLRSQGGKTIELSSCRNYLENMDLTSIARYSGEFNPISTGCYTTRIGVKQAIRAAENRLFAAEFTDLLLHSGIDFAENWKSLILSQFHDIICGCHAESAHQDALNWLKDAFVKLPDPAAENSLVSFNDYPMPQVIKSPFAPAGCAVQEDNGEYISVQQLAPYGAAEIRKNPAPVAERPQECGRCFETGFFTVDFTRPDPVITSKEGFNVFPEKDFGEIQIRRESGSMWCEAPMSLRIGKKHSGEKVVSCTRGAVFYQVVTRGEILPSEVASETITDVPNWKGFGKLEFEKTWRFYHETDYFTLDLKLFWQGCDTKIMISFPLNLDPLNSTALYDTPCAALVRKPYFEVEEAYESTMQEITDPVSLRRSKGNWPALNWVNLSDFSSGLTIANTGTPGHEIANGKISISLLRSGTQTADGALCVPPDALENGEHLYHFAFRPHSPAQMHKAGELGTLLNRPAGIVPGKLPSGSFFRADKLCVSGIRRFGENQIMIRLYEPYGQSCTVKLAGTLLKNRRIFAVDGFGNHPEELTGSKVKFKPFEIKTFLVSP